MTPSTPRTRSLWSGGSYAESTVNGVSEPMNYMPRNRLKSAEDRVPDDEEDSPESKDPEPEKKEPEVLTSSEYILPVIQWLDVVVQLCRIEKNWDLCYHLMEHFADQLMNKTLF